MGCRTEILIEEEEISAILCELAHALNQIKLDTANKPHITEYHTKTTTISSLTSLSTALTLELADGATLHLRRYTVKRNIA